MLPLFSIPREAAEASPGKVELDLEGAPFLEPEPEERPESPPPPGAEAVPARSGEGKAPKKSRKKIIILGAVLLAALLVALALAYLFFFRESEPEPPDNTEVVVVPSGAPVQPAAPVDKFQIAWEPLWAEVVDPEGEIRFVYCKVMLVTNNQRIALQLEQKHTTIRDAVYYYLRHKPYSFLADLRQLDALKSEMLNVINYYILPETVIPPGLQPGEGPPPGAPRERLQEVLIEEYLIK